MEIEVNNQKLIFNRNNQMFKEDDQMWVARLSYLEYDFCFIFSEKLFSENGLIDWNIIKEFVKHIIEEISSIQFIGIKAVEDFQKYVHIEDPFYVKDEGKFDVSDIYLVDFIKIIDEGVNGMVNTRYRFKYNADFIFETPHGLRREPTYYYTAQFSNHHTLTIIGVYNDIWSSYKED